VRDTSPRTQATFVSTASRERPFLEDSEDLDVGSHGHDEDTDRKECSVKIVPITIAVWLQTHKMKKDKREEDEAW
jgi:hypothetical protein